MKENIINEELEIIKQEIEKIWFYIYEVPEEKRKKYFLEFIKKNSIQIKTFNKIKNRLKFILKNTFLAVIVFWIIFLISLFFLYFSGKNLDFLFEVFYWFSIFLILIFLFLLFVLVLFNFIFTLLPILIFWFFRNILKYFQNSSYENIDEIKTKYIFFTEKYILFEKKFLDFDLSFLKSKYNFFQKIFKKEENIISEISKDDLEIIEKFMNNLNSEERKIFILKEKFIKLKKYLEEIKNLQIQFQKETLDENLYLNYKKIENIFLEINEKIEKSIILKEETIKNLKKFWKADFINFEKYDFWLKNNLILPIENMKNILQNHINKIEKLLFENKDNDSKQILNLNKRLELQKETLKQQILLLNKKISKIT